MEAKRSVTKRISSLVRNRTAYRSPTLLAFARCDQVTAMSPQPLRGKRLSDIKLKPRLFGGVKINARAVVAPFVAFTMAGLLYVYSTSSIQAAKRNAKSHRIADGGQISWYLLLFCSINVDISGGLLFASLQWLTLKVGDARTH